MIKNIFTANKNGFSLIELCIVLAIMAILTGSITPIFIKSIQIKAGEKTALEMSVIEEAARAYYVAYNAWPASIAALQNAGYLSSSWIANNPWQNSYNISSAINTFTVSTDLPQEWTQLVARDLPSTSIYQNTVSSTIPVPGSIAALPQGSIIIWSGNVASIPSGWALCDGNNGTPDLRDKFVVGARQDIGGVAMTNVSGTFTQVGGEAYHTLTIAEMPAHTHQYSGVSWQDRYDGGNWWSPYPGVTQTTSSTGSGQPHNNLPPYYALCFIIKLS